MALSPLNWRLLPPYTLKVGYTIFDYIDAVYQMGISTEYADGSPRTPGTGSAWTWTRDQTLVPGSTTAAIGIPPINSLGMAYILAGDTASRNPVMNTDQAYTITQNAPILGMNKNSGVYNSWVAANPMTSGQFYGFVRAPALGTFAGAAFPQLLMMMECEEGFMVAWNRTDAAAQSSFGGGALIDPLSAAALNAESDGRLYSYVTSGASNFTVATFLDGGTNGNWLVGSTGSNAQHFFTANIGAVATSRNTAKIGAYSGITNSFVAPNGEIPQIPLSAYFTPSGQYAGQLRGMNVTKNYLTGAEVAVGNAGVRTVKGYALGYSTNTQTPALLLTY
jgi:hypothetical protein